MKKQYKFIQLSIALILVCSLFAPAVFATGERIGSDRIQPHLAALIAENPDQTLRVIVQKSAATDQAELLVAELGGKVTKQFRIINGFAAEMPAKAVLKLAKVASVNWVSLDAPMTYSTSPAQTVRDEFNSTSYNNNDGTDTWAAAWIESGDDGSASSGDITVEIDECPDPTSRCIEFDGDAGLNASVQREVNLSTATYAVLAFDYHLDTSDTAYTLEASSNGGNTWNTLTVFTAAANSSGSFDLSPYAAANTRIRFRLTGGNSGGHFYLDNVEIAYTSTSATVRDEFNNISYNNNDGSVDWQAPWVEFGEFEGDDPNGGFVSVAIQKLKFFYLYYNEGIWRRVDLTGMANATLSFNWETIGLDNGTNISVLVSDGSGPYMTLDNLSGTQSGSASYDISPYISSQTTIRFENLGQNWTASNQVNIDNVQIEFTPTLELLNSFLETIGADQLHAEGTNGQGVGVAVIDSGIGDHPDFAGRLVNTPEYGNGDLYGHGTHVAGIIGGDGSASGGLYTGVAPGANLINLSVSDEYGMSYESDVVEALQWVRENRDAYNIKVVNLSLNSSVEDSYHNSAIDAAVEILWFNGIVVVVSAGNQGPDGGYNTARSAPANDPYSIAVGASDEHETMIRGDDSLTSYTAIGLSLDGLFRPDILAPGYNIVSPLSPDSSWGDSYPNRVALGKYIRLSGTSMAAPMVAGTAALLLQDEPNLTPDQVKQRLLSTSSILVSDNGIAFPYLDAYAAVHGTSMEMANVGNIPHMLLGKMALIAYWANQNGEEEIDWENVDWDAVNWESVNWNSVNWNSVNWNSVNWNSVNWNSVNWNSVNWNSVNWNSVNWNSVNWNSVNWNSVMNPPEGDAPVAGYGEVTRNDGIYWEEDEVVTPTPIACEIQVYQKGEPLSAQCTTPIWEKGNPDLPLLPVETR